MKARALDGDRCWGLLGLHGQGLGGLPCSATGSTDAPPSSAAPFLPPRPSPFTFQREIEETGSRASQMEREQPEHLLLQGRSPSCSPKARLQAVGTLLCAAPRPLAGGLPRPKLLGPLKILPSWRQEGGRGLCSWLGTVLGNKGTVSSWCPDTSVPLHGKDFEVE